jgi:hypothetical protein
MASVPVKVGDRTVWMREKKAMAEQLKVSAEGEHVVVVAEGEAGTCEVRLTFDEAQRLEEALDKAMYRVWRRVEDRRSMEATKVHGVEEEEDGA